MEIIKTGIRIMKIREAKEIKKKMRNLKKKKKTKKTKKDRRLLELYLKIHYKTCYKPIMCSLTRLMLKKE